MRKHLTLIAAIVLALAVATAGLAQQRGKGRLQGTVVDKNTGKPVAGATVKINFPNIKTEPISTKTDGKGKWAALGLPSGNWEVEVTADGYAPRLRTVQVSELQMSPPLKTELEPLARVEETTVPGDAVATTQLVPQEAIDAIRNGEQLMKEEKYKEAAAEFEKALPLMPTDNADVAVVRGQVQQVLAQAYYKGGELKKAISNLEAVVAADATNTGIALLLVNVYLEDGQLEKGKALLETLPANVVSDPTVYTNIGILFLNKQKIADAWTYFDKAVKLDEKRAESYYYRGLAALQNKKMKEAKADFEQVIALAPDSPEAGDAKKLLPSLK